MSQHRCETAIGLVTVIHAELGRWDVLFEGRPLGRITLEDGMYVARDDRGKSLGFQNLDSAAKHLGRK